MGIWCAWHKPATADTAFELVAVEGIGPVHDKLKIIELVPFPMYNNLSRFLRIHVVKPRMNFLLFGALEV